MLLTLRTNLLSVNKDQGALLNIQWEIIIVINIINNKIIVTARVIIQQFNISKMIIKNIRSFSLWRNPLIVINQLLMLLN